MYDDKAIKIYKLKELLSKILVLPKQLLLIVACLQRFSLSGMRAGWLIGKTL